MCVGIVNTYPDLVFVCLQKIGRLCSPCSTNADCVLEGGRCISLEDGDFCGQGCAGDGDCPSGYECLPFEGGQDQCAPISGNCSCTGEDPSLSRACSVTWSDPDDPEAQTYTCYGIQKCESGGWGPCLLPAEECDGADNDCNGLTDEGFLNPDTGKYDGDENCGVCGNNCTFIQAQHGQGKCDSDQVVPGCALICDEGFFDVDDNPSNGCECQYVGEEDLPGPDIPGDCEVEDCSDANCDGIDGEVEGGVFVAKFGLDSNAGTIDSPLLTIQAGIDEAASAGLRDVYVATGVYTDPVILKPGVGVYGGYSADFLVREPVSYETVVLGGAPAQGATGAVNAIGIKDSTSAVFSGFVVIGFDNKLPGNSSYAVFVIDSDDSLVISDCRIVGGDGGDGQPGVPGSSGDDGIDGQPGQQAKDIGHSNCTGQDHNKGGSGGDRTCWTTEVSGGGGGTAICPDFDESLPEDAECGADSESQSIKPEEYGGSGLNSTAGFGEGGAGGKDALISGYLDPFFGCMGFPSNGNCGTCYVPGESKTGADGTVGSPGEHGMAGVGCGEGNGTVVGGDWQAPAGGPGGSGDSGGGGGGGGAAGGVDTVGCGSSDRKHDDIGGSGGGGGSGGCGAIGGLGGGSGGGSFTIFVSFSAPPDSIPLISNCVIEIGRGGNGGNGGIGGVGGSAGAGASGGTDAADQDETFCTSGGGHGGSGGSGGHGGGGGGGCGGPAWGLFVHGADQAQTQQYLNADITFQGQGAGGHGGLGGASIGNLGEDGADGTAGEMSL